MATASILEGVGVSAVSTFMGLPPLLNAESQTLNLDLIFQYLGAAAEITSGAYLTAAGSILTVEARHSSYVRGELGEVPFPSAFDIPLDFDQVYSLASLFIKSCPDSNPSLPVKAFPALTATASGSNMVKLAPADDSVFAGHMGDLYAIWVGYPDNAVVSISSRLQGLF